LTPELVVLLRFKISRIFLSSISAIALIFAVAVSPAQAAISVSVASVTDGPTTFIKFVHLTGSSVGSLKTVSLQIAAKPGATAAPITASYSADYLLGHGYLNTGANTATVPVYGLYQSYANQVSIKFSGRGGSATLSQTITTGAWDNSCNDAYSNKTNVVTRNSRIKLDYSYFMLKGWVCNAHPVVMDIDGQVRWAGTAGNGEQGSSFLGNSFYLGGGSSLYKIETDGTYAEVGNYSSGGYWGFHHNIDFGKDGLPLDLHHNSDVESNIIEVNSAEQVLRSWDLAAIFDAAMIAGGDDPSGFVNHNYGDWFHNNAATYWKQRNELVVSSRENFVVGIGYDDRQIHWILGDRDKAWFQNYPSLRPFALNLTAGTHPPIGQHAVSITSAGNLMLFDNGYQSFNHSPSGSSRSYSSPRQYQITIKGSKFEAKEVWSFEHSQTVWSPICSSIYQSGTSYLIDYASEGGGIRLVGLDSQSHIAFEYKLPGTAYYSGWNALPIGFQNLTY
jgi:arylsulfate sulfotransferase